MNTRGGNPLLWYEDTTSGSGGSETRSSKLVEYDKVFSTPMLRSSPFPLHRMSICAAGYWRVDTGLHGHLLWLHTAVLVFLRSMLRPMYKKGGGVQFPYFKLTALCGSGRQLLFIFVRPPRPPCVLLDMVPSLPLGKDVCTASSR